MQNVWARQSCPGGAYYVCQNGFKGCCSTDPCKPGGTCSDTLSHDSIITTAATPTSLTIRHSEVVALSRPTSSRLQTTLPISPSPTTTTAFISIMRPPSSTLWERASQAISSTLVRAVTTASDLTCPSANGTTYTKANKNSYNIHCNSDNNFTSFSTVSIEQGGFTSCFGACDNVTSCGGFTFVGLDGGSCYLKRSMPTDRFVDREGDNYISVVRIDRVDAPLASSSSSSVTTSLTSSSSSTSSSTSGSKSGTPIGAIAGGVGGGVAAIVLILLVVAILVRRRRKRLAAGRAATKTHTVIGPLESPKKDEGSDRGEIFAPYGGFYRRTADSPNADLVTPHVLKGETSSNKPPVEIFSVSGPAQLDGTPVYSTTFRDPPSNMVEMEGTSPSAINNRHLLSREASVASKSPILGRMGADSGRTVPVQTARRHVMSWNTHDDREAMSYSSTMSSAISPMIVSPPDASPAPQYDAWHRRG